MSKLTYVLKISKTALYEKIADKAFEHDVAYGPNAPKFDAATGKALWVFREAKVPAYASGKLNGLCVVELKDAALIYSSTKLALPDVSSYGFLPAGALAEFAAAADAANSELQAAANLIGDGVYVAENVRTTYVV